MIFINILNFPDIFMSEHKLLVQIFKINDIKTDHVNFTEISKNRILK